MGGPVLKEVREDDPDIDTSQEGDAGEEKGTPSIPARLSWERWGQGHLTTFISGILNHRDNWILYETLRPQHRWQQAALDPGFPSQLVPVWGLTSTMKNIKGWQKNDRCWVLCSSTSHLHHCIGLRRVTRLWESFRCRNKTSIKEKHDQVNNAEHAGLKCCTLEVAEAPDSCQGKSCSGFWGI